MTKRCRSGAGCCSWLFEEKLSTSVLNVFNYAVADCRSPLTPLYYRPGRSLAVGLFECLLMCLLTSLDVSSVCRSLIMKQWNKWCRNAWKRRLPSQLEYERHFLSATHWVAVAQGRWVANAWFQPFRCRFAVGISRCRFRTPLPLRIFLLFTAAAVGNFLTKFLQNNGIFTTAERHRNCGNRAWQSDYR